MSVFALSEIIVLFLLGLVAIPTPLSVPPLPEDQNLLRAAPVETVAYFSWFGRADANPRSQNLTERLAAEPEVRSLVLAAGKALRKAWEIEAGEDAELATECFNMLALAADRPGCVFVAGADWPPEPFSIRAGLVVHLGARAVLIAPTLRELERWLVDEMTRGDGEVHTFEPMPGLKFRGLPMPEEAPSVSWGMVDGYLVVAVGEGMAKRIASGLRGETAGMTDHLLFKQVQAKVRVARPCFRTFIDLAQIVEKAGISAGRDVAKILQALGLTDLQAVLSEAGLEGEGFVARSMLATKGRSGLLKLVDGPPLAAKDLAVIPADATLASAIRVSPRRLYEQMLHFVGMLDPNAPEQFKTEVAGAIEQTTGLDLEKDLLAHMGDTLTLWNSPRQGGLLFTGLTVALELDDAELFGKSFAKAMGSLAEMMPKKERSRWGRMRRGTYLETTRGPGGVKIWFLNTVGDAMPFAPAWCVTDQHLMVSLFPQMLKASLARGVKFEGSLATHPKVRAVPEAVALTFFDASRMFDSLYPALHLLAQLTVSQLQRGGVDVTIAALPTAASIRPHMSTEMSSLVVRPDGLLWTRKGTIPTIDPILGFAAPAFAAIQMWMMQWWRAAAMREARAQAMARRAKARERDKEQQKKKKQQQQKNNEQRQN